MSPRPAPDAATRQQAARRLRFERLAVTCVFGDPRQPRTWSGAPNNLAVALEQLGVTVYGVAPRIGKAGKLSLAARHLLGLGGRLSSTEQLLRSAAARREHALQVARAVETLGTRDVLHMGTLDLPAIDRLNARHYVYCDQTWDLSLRHRPDAADYPLRARREFEALECAAFASAEHIFTFGNYVRDNLVEHYGIGAERVTAVGSGMGAIEPYAGPKDYSRPWLMFVAKHLFQAKGGPLLLDAVEIARREIPDLRLTVVGDERSRRFVPDLPHIDFRAHLPWAELQQLYRDVTLLTQPMLNDPWGQVYLEALVSRTPVLGLNRNGLPEITQGGQHGFLVDEADPKCLAEVLVDALRDPSRLCAMGSSGQRHAIDSYSWNRVAEMVAYA